MSRDKNEKLVVKHLMLKGWEEGKDGCHGEWIRWDFSRLPLPASRLLLVAGGQQVLWEVANVT